MSRNAVASKLLMALVGLGCAAGLSAQAQATAAAPVRWWGIVDVTIDIAIYGGLPSGDQVWCSVAVGTSDVGGTNATYGADSFAQASAVAGATTATCTVSVPYEWLISPTTAGTDNLVVTYDAYIVNPSGLTVAGAKLYVHHSSTSPAALVTLPANGATTNFTFNTRL